MAIFMHLGGMTAPPVSHGWIELLTFSFDMTVRRSPGSLRPSASRLALGMAIATKLSDRASAELIRLSLAGRRLPLCLVNFTRADAPNSVAADGFTLHDVMIVAFRGMRYSPMPKRVDEAVLGFEKITLGHHSSRKLSPMEAEALSKMWRVSAGN